MIKFVTLLNKYVGVYGHPNGYQARYNGQYVGFNINCKVAASFVNFVASKMGDDIPNKGVKCIDPKSVTRNPRKPKVTRHLCCV